MLFYLGTHEAHWLGIAGVPLFVSRRRLARRKALPVAIERWALDSGGFTEISMHGRWEVEPASYADEASRYQAEVGRLDFAAIQDWMCEGHMLEKTGKTIAEHQELTILSYLDLKALAPSVPWLPVLQGWEVDDYLGHAEQYRRAGVDLASLPVVGVGSVCRRQATDEAAQIFAELHAIGIRCHGFGLKTEGVKKASIYLASSDSMAWSVHARRRPPLAGCEHRSCANCMRYALAWRGQVLEAIARPSQQRVAWGMA